MFEETGGSADRQQATGLWRRAADIAALMSDIVTPPVAEIGALPIDSFMKKKGWSLSQLLASLLAREMP